MVVLPATTNARTARSDTVHALDTTKPKVANCFGYPTHPTLCGSYIWHGSYRTPSEVTCARCLRILVKQAVR